MQYKLNYIEEKKALKISLTANKIKIKCLNKFETCLVGPPLPAYEAHTV